MILTAQEAQDGLYSFIGKIPRGDAQNATQRPGGGQEAEKSPLPSAYIDNIGSPKKRRGHEPAQGAGEAILFIGMSAPSAAADPAQIMAETTGGSMKKQSTQDSPIDHIFTILRKWARALDGVLHPIPANIGPRASARGAGMKS